MAKSFQMTFKTFGTHEIDLVHPRMGIVGCYAPRNSRVYDDNSVGGSGARAVAG